MKPYTRFGGNKARNICNFFVRQKILSSAMRVSVIYKTLFIISLSNQRLLGKRVAHYESLSHTVVVEEHISIFQEMNISGRRNQLDHETVCSLI